MHSVAQNIAHYQDLFFTKSNHSHTRKRYITTRDTSLKRATPPLNLKDTKRFATF